LRESDLSVKTTKDSGPGGQNRNKVETAVQMLHKPSGLAVNICIGKSQSQNKKLAKQILKDKLQSMANKSAKNKKNKKRRKQIGAGLRGDKIRTIQEQNRCVINHSNGKKMTYKKYCKGYVEKLHD